MQLFSVITGELARKGRPMDCPIVQYMLYAGLFQGFATEDDFLRLKAHGFIALVDVETGDTHVYSPSYFPVRGYP